MTLPPSSGKPDADQLLQETMEIKDPFGVKTLVIHPEDFEGDSPEAVREKLRAITNKFFADVTSGDAKGQEELSKIFDSKRFDYVRDMTVKSARDKNYSDAHNASLDDSAGHHCSIIVAPRLNIPFAKAAHDLTGVSEQALASLPVSSNEDRLLTYWHEFAHGTGAGEPQADKMSAIIYRQSFSDTQQLKIRADMRALDAVFTHDRFMDPDRKWARCEIYGWAPVEAIDSVIDMPESEIKNMDENAIRSFSSEKFDKKVTALHSVGNILYQKIPEAMKQRNLPDIAREVRTLMVKGEFGSQGSDTYHVASRFLVALDRTNAAGLDVASERTRKKTASPVPAVM
ncbi:MAG TPA: hypothetical protein VL625_07070 [Patescibacteria group bacterium]|nr:hypothetical protein [Patescibacteria group bacterium]